MENASKALIMAGSVLLALVIISALVFMFNSLRGLKTEEANSDEAKKLAEFNQKIELYNRDLYGSELISLANLIEDYNSREANAYTGGYKQITFKVTMTEISVEMNGYMDKVYTSYEKLVNDYENNIENHLKNLKKTEKILNINIKSGKDWYGMTQEQKDTFLRNLQSTKNLNDTQIDTIREKMEEFADDYSNTITASNTFKNRKFEPISFEYDDYTGRVNKIEFKVKPA